MGARADQSHGTWRRVPPHVRRRVLDTGAVTHAARSLAGGRLRDLRPAAMPACQSLSLSVFAWVCERVVRLYTEMSRGPQSDLRPPPAAAGPGERELLIRRCGGENAPADGNRPPAASQQLTWAELREKDCGRTGLVRLTSQQTFSAADQRC